MKEEKIYYVYIITNKLHTVLYIGTTRDLQHRILQHKNKEIKGFSSKYNLNKLVYYEEFEMAIEAFDREKQLKRWRRSKKELLIGTLNIERIDLSKSWF